MGAGGSMGWGDGRRGDKGPGLRLFRARTLGSAGVWLAGEGPTVTTAAPRYGAGIL